MGIEGHRLDDAGVQHVTLPGAKGATEPIQPDTIVIHYTAGASGESAVRTFMDPNVAASAHLVVDFDGSICQCVPFNRKAWHAGKSRHLDREGLNRYSIGIEIVNAGRLKKTGSKYTSWFGRQYDEEDVFIGIHRNETTPTPWHRYTEDQTRVVGELCLLLAAHYDVKYIVGHEEISPGRKIDPGPAFPLDKMRNRVLNLDPRDAEEAPDVSVPSTGFVTTGSLNIRSGPSPSHERVARPLSRGAEVVIVVERGGWYRVRANVEGWVSSRFVGKG